MRSLPSDQTERAGVQKVILRHVMRGYLPDEVLDLTGKIYPVAIARRGFRERESAKVWRLMQGMRAADLGFVDQKGLHEAYRQYLAGGSDSVLFWYPITLEAWLRQYFD